MICLFIREEATRTYLHIWYRVSHKKFQFAFSASSRLPKIEISFVIKITDKLLSLTILKIFGQCQNCQNSIFTWPYQLYKAISGKHFFVKMFTMMFLLMYQVFSSQHGHLHFLELFLLPFMENLFMTHPIFLGTKRKYVSTSFSRKMRCQIFFKEIQEILHLRKRRTMATCCRCVARTYIWSDLAVGDARKARRRTSPLHLRSRLHLDHDLSWATWRET